MVKKGAEIGWKEEICYVGKATKIFIFIVTILAAIGILFGFILLRRHAQSHNTTPVELPQPTFINTSNPFHNPIPTAPPPPLTDNPSPRVPDSPPPPKSIQAFPPQPVTSVPPPPPAASNASPPPPVTSYASPPPPPVEVSGAPPPALSHPSPVTVTPGPASNS